MMIDFINRKLLDIYREAYEVSNWTYDDWLDKKTLINDVLMNGQSKISFEVDANKNSTEIISEITDLMLNLNYRFTLGPEVRRYMHQFILKCLPKGEEAKAIERNKVTEKVKGRNGIYQKGMKLTKVFKREFSQLVADEVVEEFLKRYSMVIQSAHIKDTVYISTLPEDIITMSDNTNDWSSCMSTDSQYLYRMGIVEYMQSSKVAIAYTKSRTELAPGVDNKKWRSLIMLSEGYKHDDKQTYMVIEVKKPYPYKSQQIIGAINNYFNENIEHSVTSSDDYEKSIHTRYHGFKQAYVDETYTTIHFKAFGDSMLELVTEGAYYNCPFCGSSDVCSCLDSVTECAICGEFHHDDQMIYVDGYDYVCEGCFDADFGYCSECGEAVEYDALVIVDDYDDVCDYCAEMYYERCKECGDLVHEDEIDGGVCDYCEREA